MPGKSQHKRGRHSIPSKRKKGKPSRATVIARQPTAAQPLEPVTSSDVPSLTTSVPNPATRLAAVPNLYIANELRTIGILAAIMLIVLVVLALVLS